MKELEEDMPKPKLMDGGQRAREFLTREGHTKAVADVTVKDGSKSAIVHAHHIGRPQPAKANQRYPAGQMGGDGVLRGHVGDCS